MNFAKNMTLPLPHSRDWMSSFVVFIVALPLSLGIAIASGAPPAAGLVTAVIGGILVGALSGAPLVVTGPAAGLTAIVLQMVQTHGLEGVALITVFAGLFQALFGIVRAGKLIAMIPKVVLEGVLSSIGLIITISQLHTFMGRSKSKSPTQSFLALPESFTEMMVEAEWGIPAVLLVGFLALGIQLAWTRLFPALKLIPASLPAVVIGTLASLAADMPRVEIAPILPEIKEGFHTFLNSHFFQSFQTYALPALGLTIVASAETLLTARAADVLLSKRKDYKPSSPNRELMAQGIGNLVSGIVGGLPMTGVMVRTAANIDAGGQTRWSTMLHGLWIALFVGFLPFVLAKIPLTALAAVLIIIGTKLINLPHLIHTLKHDRVEGLLWVATIAAVFFTDLLKGLGIAVVLYFIVKAYVNRVLHKRSRQHKAPHTEVR